MSGGGVITHPRVVVVLAALMLIIPLAACGGSSSAPLALEGIIGYWQADTIAAAAPGVDVGGLIQVEKRAGEYYLGINGQPPKPATFAHGRILLPWSSVSGEPIEFGLDGGQAAVFTPQAEGPSPQPAPSARQLFVSAPVTKLTEPQYEQLTAEWAERQLQGNLSALHLLLLEWGMNHDLPAVGELTRDSEFGRWAEGRETWPDGPTGWPLDPYTGGWMQAGYDVGDFTYELSASGLPDFTLIAHLPDGRRLSAGDLPAPLPSASPHPDPSPVAGPPPDWLRATVARLLAGRGKVSGLWYTKTSEYFAQRAILEDDGGDPDRDAYLVLVQGDLTIGPELVPYLHAEESAKWLLVEFDTGSRVRRSIVAANLRPDTSEVDPLVSFTLVDQAGL